MRRLIFEMLRSTLFFGYFSQASAVHFSAEA